MHIHLRTLRFRMAVLHAAMIQLRCVCSLSFGMKLLADIDLIVNLKLNYSVAVPYFYIWFMLIKSFFLLMRMLNVV